MEVLNIFFTFSKDMMNVLLVVELLDLSGKISFWSYLGSFLSYIVVFLFLGELS